MTATGEATDQTFNAARPATVHDERPWSQYRYVNRQIRTTVASFASTVGLPAGASILDFGCATKPYRSLFPADARFVGADLAGNDAADVVIDAAGRLEERGETYDLVLSTQVLEHVVSPAVYLQEAFRVLRPGGYLLLTTHGLMYYHRDPEDYWRWTSDGLRRLVTEHGFEVARCEGMLALAPAALQLFQDATCKHLPKLVWRPYITGFQAAIAWIDGHCSDESRRNDSLVIGVLARKPDEESRDDL